MAKVDARPTAVVAAATTWPQFPALWGQLLGEVWDAGTAAMTVHRGPFGNLGAAHDAVWGWCAAHGHQLDGTRWEIYGPHNDDPGRQWTEVYWRLS